MAKILVIAEIVGGSLKKTTLSAVTFARQVAQASGGSFDILALGKGFEKASAELRTYGAGTVHIADDDYLASYVGERFSPTVTKVAKAGSYDVVVVTASVYGKDLAP